MKANKTNVKKLIDVATVILDFCHSITEDENEKKILDKCHSIIEGKEVELINFIVEKLNREERNE